MKIEGTKNANVRCAFDFNGTCALEHSMLSFSKPHLKHWDSFLSKHRSASLSANYVWTGMSVQMIYRRLAKAYPTVTANFLKHKAV